MLTKRPLAVLLTLSLLTSTLPALADTPDGTRHYFLAGVDFQLISQSGRLTLVVVDPSGKLNIQAPFSTTAEQAKVPPAVLNAYRLARTRDDLGLIEGDEWTVLSSKIAPLIQMQQWLSAGFEGDPLQLGAAGPADPDNPLAASLQQIRQCLAINSPDADLKTALTQYRDARKKLSDDLAQAQLNLMKVVTIRQETILVRIGILK